MEEKTCTILKRRIDGRDRLSFVELTSPPLTFCPYRIELDLYPISIYHGTAFRFCIIYITLIRRAPLGSIPIAMTAVKVRTTKSDKDAYINIESNQ